MDAGGPKGKQKSDINVTPLIDIVLVLLIVFIVMVPGLAKAMKVVVPQIVQTTTPPKIDPNNPPVVISLDKDGKMMLQADPIDADGIKQKLPDIVMLQPLGFRKVFLKIDEDTKFQSAVDVLDAIRVASDDAKKKSLEQVDKFQGQDGGDIKVAVSLLKKPEAATAPVNAKG
jgi:biopolymer transport protein ExbD